MPNYKQIGALISRARAKLMQADFCDVKVLGFRLNQRHTYNLSVCKLKVIKLKKILVGFHYTILILKIKEVSKNLKSVSCQKYVLYIIDNVLKYGPNCQNCF